MDDFVTTNFGTRAPRARAPLEQNSGDANGGVVELRIFIGSSAEILWIKQTREIFVIPFYIG